jgi:hypothetical protein
MHSHRREEDITAAKPTCARQPSVADEKERDAKYNKPSISVESKLPIVKPRSDGCVKQSGSSVTIVEVNTCTQNPLPGVAKVENS